MADVIFSARMERHVIKPQTFVLLFFFSILVLADVSFIENLTTEFEICFCSRFFDLETYDLFHIQVSIMIFPLYPLPFLDTIT